MKIENKKDKLVIVDGDTRIFISKIIKHVIVSMGDKTVDISDTGFENKADITIVNQKDEGKLYG